MSGVGQEASGVGQHSYESGQITQVSQGDHLILHAGLVIIEPPGGTLLDLGNSGGILETSEDGTDSLIVVRIQTVNDSSGKLVTYDQSVQEVSHLSGRSVVVDAVVTGIGTQLLEHQGVVVTLTTVVQLHSPVELMIFAAYEQHEGGLEFQFLFLGQNHLVQSL